jgi:chromosome segregation ATPase
VKGLQDKLDGLKEALHNAVAQVQQQQKQLSQGHADLDAAREALAAEEQQSADLRQMLQEAEVSQVDTAVVQLA